MPRKKGQPKTTSEHRKDRLAKRMIEFEALPPERKALVLEKEKKFVPICFTNKGGCGETLSIYQFGWRWRGASEGRERLSVENICLMCAYKKKQNSINTREELTRKARIEKKLKSGDDEDKTRSWSKGKLDHKGPTPGLIDHLFFCRVPVPKYLIELKEKKREEMQLR